MTLYVGTAGWSYPSGGGKWDGVFYPEGMAGWQKLSYYAERFNAVEINSSFYRPMSPSDARGWARRTPDGFRFTAKLWQKFTHPKMFEESSGKPAEVRQEDFEQFRKGLDPLCDAGKMGALVAQFPPSFKAGEGAYDYLEDLLRRFADVPLAVELRHRSWGEDQRTRGLFEELGVAWVMIDEPKFRTSIRDVPLTSRLGYFRFHGRNYEQWWKHDAAEDRYNYLYPAEELQELASEVREVAERTQDTYAFYNNHYGAKAVVNATELKAQLGLPVPGEWNMELLKEYLDLEELVRRAQS
jgi:uncharacterized protein YecE (DUF72 family)